MLHNPYFLACRPANYEYDGPPPPLEMFADEFTTEEKKADIEAFLNSYEESSYNFKNELHKYVVQDVR